MLFEIGRILHDSIDSLSPEGERKQIAKLITSGFVLKIDYGNDFEQQLSSMVECRAIFCNLDEVMEVLVLCVVNLVMKALRAVKGKHSKKTSAFVKACLAYCHITIPSITRISTKLDLLLYCTQIALVNNCLPQTDTFLKAAISLIPEMETTEGMNCVL